LQARSALQRKFIIFDTENTSIHIKSSPEAVFRFLIDCPVFGTLPQWPGAFTASASLLPAAITATTRGDAGATADRKYAGNPPFRHLPSLCPLPFLLLRAFTCVVTVLFSCHLTVIVLFMQIN